MVYIATHLMWEKSFTELSTLAGRQEGLITGAQASRSGIATGALDQLKQAGLLVELDWDVYQLAGSSLAPRYAYPLAAWLSLRPERFHWERVEGEPDAVLSHESACNLHGLGSLSAPLEVFTLPNELPPPRGTRIHVGRLGADDITTCAQIPVTTPRRTILDLVLDWTEHADIARALADAVQHDLVDLQAVHRDLAPLAAEHDFPAEGRDFVAYFVPSLAPASLSVRNQRAYANLVFPQRVDAWQQRLERLIEDEGSPGDKRLSLDIAGEIVARVDQP